MKYWTKRGTAATMGSYFLECLILDYYERNSSGSNIDVELKNLLAFIYQRVHQSLPDPKEFQGDLNTLTWEERNSIQTRTSLDYNRAVDAISLKTAYKEKEAIAKWCEVFGSDFPNYA